MDPLNRLALAAVSAVITVAGAAFSLNGSAGREKIQSTISAENIVAGILDHARERARASTLGGATVVIVAGAKSEEVYIYDGRPEPNVTMPTTPIAGPYVLPIGVASSAPGVATAVPIAITIASDGTSAAASWGPGTGAISQPSCPASGIQTVVFANGSEKTTGSLNCQTTSMQ